LQSGERRTQERRVEDQDDDPLEEQMSFLEAELDKLDSIPDASPQDNPERSSNHHSDESTIPTLVASSDNAPAVENQKKLSAAEQQRLHALKSMLNASDARFRQATKKRRPVFAAGLSVKVLEGEHANLLGVVLDADYIESRALVSLPDEEAPQWFEFGQLGNPD